MKSSRKSLKEAVGVLLSLNLGACVFGENQQFFSQVTGGKTIASNSGPTQSGSSNGDTPSPEGTPNPDPSPNPSPSATPSPSPTPGGGGGVSNSYSDLFNVAVAAGNKVDILFCIDNSPSMSDNQRILADSFGGFIQAFTQKGLDFHIGIITSDVDTTRSSTWASRLPDYPGANRGRVLTRYSSDRYLTPQTSGLVSKFQDNARVGTAGSSREQCLNSFIYAMEDSQILNGGWNAGFFRADALHSFVVVSDENEDIQDGETIEARVDRLKARVAAISNQSSHGSRFDFIINKSVAAPSRTPAPGEVQYYPARYLAASSILAGQTYDISKDFSQDLLGISQGTAQQAVSEFKLSHIPQNVASIQVSIGGVLVAESAIHGWVYHADRNTIELTGSTPVEAEGKELKIQYQ
jgi:hypothetical protein